MSRRICAFLFFVLIWVSCVFPAVGQISGNVLRRNAFQVGGGAGDTGTDLDQDGNIDADGNISAGGNLLVGGALGIGGTPPGTAALYADGHIAIGPNEFYGVNIYYDAGFKFTKNGPYYGGFYSHFATGGGRISTSTNSGHAGAAANVVDVLNWAASGDLTIDHDLLVDGTLGIDGTPPGSIGLYIPNGGVALGKNESYLTNIYYDSGWKFAEDGPSYGGGLKFKAGGGGDLITSSNSGNAGDSATVIVVLSWTAPGDVTIPYNLFVDGGDFVVGSGDNGKLGTTTNQNQLEFVDATHTAIEDVLKVDALVRTPTTITTDTTPTAVSRGVIIIGAWDTSNDITDFDNETAGQKLIILGGDADCNVVDGAPIQLVGGTTWNAASGATLEILSDGTIWYELSRSAT